ncbi:hypothetical protein LIA77_02609 [Sarocladium implicatum]|nr:hypothetical protein LIA77_02609 [Sarocladium implicatum]
MLLDWHRQAWTHMETGEVIIAMCESRSRSVSYVAWTALVGPRCPGSLKHRIFEDTASSIDLAGSRHYWPTSAGDGFLQKAWVSDETAHLLRESIPQQSTF